MIAPQSTERGIFSSGKEAGDVTHEMGSAFTLWMARPGAALVARQLSSTVLGNWFFNTAEPGSCINLSLACSFGRFVSGNHLANPVLRLADVSNSLSEND